LPLLVIKDCVYSSSWGKITNMVDLWWYAHFKTHQ